MQRTRPVGPASVPRHQHPELSSPTHPDGSQAPDHRPGDFYVTVVNDKKVGYLSGPYPGHARALSDVTRVTKIARHLDNSPDSHFYSFGTARIDGGTHEPGLLQRMGILTSPRSDAQPDITTTPNQALTNNDVINDRKLTS